MQERENLDGRWEATVAMEPTTPARGSEPNRVSRSEAPPPGFEVPGLQPLGGMCVMYGRMSKND